jgi:hypothetical protein
MLETLMARLAANLTEMAGTNSAGAEVTTEPNSRGFLRGKAEAYALAARWIADKVEEAHALEKNARRRDRRNGRQEVTSAPAAPVEAS